VLDERRRAKPAHNANNNKKTEPATRILDQTRDASMQVASSFRS
jgi:hypothetical protein